MGLLIVTWVVGVFHGTLPTPLAFPKQIILSKVLTGSFCVRIGTSHVSTSDPPCCLKNGILRKDQTLVGVLFGSNFLPIYRHLGKSCFRSACLGVEAMAPQCLPGRSRRKSLHNNSPSGGFSCFTCKWIFWLLPVWEPFLGAPKPIL